MSKNDEAIRVGHVPDRATHVFHGYTKNKLRYETWIQGHDTMAEVEVNMLKRLGCDRVTVTKRPSRAL